jgi:hypothetical protein
MNDNSNTILVGAYRYNASPMSQPCSTVHRGRATVRHRFAAFDRFAARLDYARWLGRKPTSAERRARSRELVRLEEEGLLVRLNGYGGNRITHIKLMEEGEVEARRLLDGAVELLPIEAPWKDEDEVPAQ